MTALALALAAVPARGENYVGSTTKKGALTGGHAVRDGVQTFGRSVGAFFRGGPRAAKETWNANAARTRANAKAGAHATKQAAQGD